MQIEEKSNKVNKVIYAQKCSARLESVRIRRPLTLPSAQRWLRLAQSVVTRQDSSPGKCLEAGHF